MRKRRGKKDARAAKPCPHVRRVLAAARELCKRGGSYVAPGDVGALIVAMRAYDRAHKPKITTAPAKPPGAYYEPGTSPAPTPTPTPPPPPPREPEGEIAQMVCHGCGASYYAMIVERGGRWEIGERVPKPSGNVKVRRQNMRCGDCQTRMSGDPFGLGI